MELARLTAGPAARAPTAKPDPEPLDALFRAWLAEATAAPEAAATDAAAEATAAPEAAASTIDMSAVKLMQDGVLNVGIPVMWNVEKK